MATPVVRLGGITFGTPDEDGDLFIVGDIVGWTSVPVELATVEKPVSNGAVIAYARLRARSLVVSGTAIAEEDGDVWRVRDKLESVAGGMVASDGTLAVDEPGETVTLTVRLSADIQVRPLGSSAIQFEIPLLAANPTKAISGS